MTSFLQLTRQSYCLLSRLARMEAQSLAFLLKHLVIFLHLPRAQSSG